MAHQLTWSSRVLRELAEIADFIGQDSPNYAGMVLERFFARAERLPDQPRQGRRVPEYQGKHEMREVFVHRWRMVYKVTDTTVEIVTVIHGARLIENAPPL